jgi:hypothetical protein
MSERILGPTGSKRRRRFQWVPMLVIAALALFFAVGAQAVHDTGAFELDGNATNGAVVGDDWDNVCHQVSASACPTATNTNGAAAVNWVAEPNPSASIFTGGGSKDPQDISSWAWKDAGGLPDKDNLQHSFSARYSLAPSATCPAGTATTCDLLYFGSDRFDNSGDAQQGFWFFQNAIGLNGGSVGGGTGFTGLHKNGDVLIISDFSNGGTTSTISVYKWNSAVSGNLQLLQTSTAANCITAAANDAFCGLVNAGTITMPWSFADKSATPNNGALNGEFYEGGINLSTLGLSGECFSSVASETRSSTSTTATLKDFVLGQLQNCSSSLTTNVSTTTVAIGSSLTDSATIHAVGGSNPPAPTGTVSFYVCGPSASTCAPAGTAFDTEPLSGAVQSTNDYTVTSASFTPNSAGTWCFAA